MEEFLKRLAEILEVDEVQGSSVLRDFAEWDSLSALSVIAMLDAGYGVQLSANDLKNLDTAEGLYDLVLERRRK
jgi:acyl carrier protein